MITTRQDITLQVGAGPGTRTLPALPTPVPGLWIAEENPSCFHVVHKGSGGAVVSGAPDPEAALAAAIKLGDLADWTQHVLDIRDLFQADHSLIATHGDILRSCHANPSYYASREEVASWEPLP